MHCGNSSSQTHQFSNIVFPLNLEIAAKIPKETLVCTWMGDHSGMSISADSPSDETLNRGPLALLLRRQYEFPFGINIVQFSILLFVFSSLFF